MADGARRGPVISSAGRAARRASAAAGRVRGTTIGARVDKATSARQAVMARGTPRAVAARTESESLRGLARIGGRRASATRGVPGGTIAMRSGARGNAMMIGARRGGMTSARRVVMARGVPKAVAVRTESESPRGLARTGGRHTSATRGARGGTIATTSGARVNAMTIAARRGGRTTSVRQAVAPKVVTVRGAAAGQRRKVAAGHRLVAPSARAGVPLSAGRRTGVGRFPANAGQQRRPPLSA